MIPWISPNALPWQAPCANTARPPLAMVVGSYDEDAAVYIAATSPGDPARTNALFVGLKSIGLYDYLDAGLLWGSDFNSSSDLTWLDGTATGVAANARGGYLKAGVSGAFYSPLFAHSDEKTIVHVGAGITDYASWAAVGREPIRLATEPYSFPSGYGFVRLQTSSANAFASGQNAANSTGQSFTATLMDFALPIQQVTALRARGVATASFDSSVNGAAWVNHGATVTWGGKLMRKVLLGNAAGFYQGSFVFSKRLDDAEIAALQTLIRSTIQGGRARLVCEGDSYMGNGVYTNTPFFLTTRTDIAGLLYNPTNLAVGGTKYVDRAATWDADDPAAPYASAGAGDRVIFLGHAGHNDLSNSDGTPSATVIAAAVAAADEIYTRAKELGMRTVCVSTMRNAAINFDGRVADGSVETLNAALAALDSVDQFIDANASFRSTYGDSYWTDTDIYDVDGIHPSQAVTGGYKQIADVIAAELIF